MKILTHLLLLCAFLFPSSLFAAQINISASVFPVWLLLRQVTANVPQAHISLILPAGTGCPHDYAPTPQDRKALASADILVINGLGLESFLGTGDQLKSCLKKGALVIDASRNLSGILKNGDTDIHEAHHDADHEGGHESHHHGHIHDDHHDADHEGGHEEHHHEHHHGLWNPHIFASPSMMGQMALSVAGQLAGADPANADLYRENARAFKARLDALAHEFRELPARHGKKSVLVQHDIFLYLARDMGIEVDGLIQKHEGIDPSARELLELARLIRARGTSAIITEPQYPARNGEMLSRETGVPCIELDPVAGGPEDAPMDYYERAMHRNLQILRQAFGSK